VMASHDGQESLVEKRVTYTLELNGQIFLVENVPARVNEETGEQFFSPAIVERLQAIILEGQRPDRMIETPVYNYVA
jgi:YgiT-type zinc finger domain-containing protein